MMKEEIYMKILFVGSYPNNINPYMSVFFRELIYEMADQGNECYVIAPVSFTKYKSKTLKIPKQVDEHTPEGAVIHVYHPRIVSYSAKKIGSINTMEWTERAVESAAVKQCKRINVSFDCVYGHFFLGGGLSAAKIAQTYNIPAFIAYGECNFETEVSNKYLIKKEHMRGVRGIIAVSSKNLNDIRNRSFADGIPTVLCLNAINQNQFYLKDKISCREKLGLPQKEFIVGFVGYFIERKGSNRLLEACRGLEGVSLAFAGRGDDIPKGDNVVFCKSLKHEEVSDFLNAVDVFCLPTQNEGCSNAIVEAMACGKTIVSSDLPFNHDILNSSNSVLIDPNSISEIRDAIIVLRDSKELCAQLSSQALHDAQELNLAARARKISEFIKSNI